MNSSALKDTISFNNRCSLFSKSFTWPICKVSAPFSSRALDISESTYNKIVEKYQEIEKYNQETLEKISEKKTNVTTLQTEYLNLLKSETAEETEINIAKEKYDKAYEELQAYIKSVETETLALQEKFYETIPNYTDSWIEINNTTNNISLDFKNYSGKIYFILWAKIENEENTYYNFQIYSNELKFVA